VRENDFRAVGDELGCLTLHERKIAGWPAYIEDDVLSVDPVQFLQRLLECRKPDLSFTGGLRDAHQCTDPAHALLRPRCRWPRCHRATQNTEKIPPPHAHPRQKAASYSLQRALW
jgi:hypothetical protein